MGDAIEHRRMQPLPRSARHRELLRHRHARHLPLRLLSESMQDTTRQPSTRSTWWPADERFASSDATSTPPTMRPTRTTATADCRWVIGNIDESSVSGMKALKFNENHPHLAFMALHVFYDHGNAISSENDLVAILDTGCNMSCHGSRWLERYTRATNQPMTMTS